MFYFFILKKKLFAILNSRVVSLEEPPYRTWTTFPVSVRVAGHSLPRTVSSSLRASNLVVALSWSPSHLSFSRISWVFKRPTVFKSCVNAFVAAAFHREELSCLLRLQLKRSAEEMSSWGLEILKTTGPVFVMIDQCFDNGAKGGFDNFPGLLLKPQHDYAGLLGSPWSLFSPILRAVDLDSQKCSFSH